MVPQYSKLKTKGKKQKERIRFARVRNNSTVLVFHISFTSVSIFKRTQNPKALYTNKKKRSNCTTFNSLRINGVNRQFLFYPINLQDTALVPCIGNRLRKSSLIATQIRFFPLLFFYYPFLLSAKEASVWVDR